MAQYDRDFELDQLKQELDRRTAWLLGAYCWLSPADRKMQLQSISKDLVQELMDLAKRDKVTLDNKDTPYASSESLLMGRLNIFIRVAEEVLDGK